MIKDSVENAHWTQIVSIRFEVAGIGWKNETDLILVSSKSF